ncbi:unnamed protein product [Phaedon cochleariae]|uniref:Uncharacterized protein n=1 Tax=Phaedon cochleariae TaxID=80249 RepID=A0A9N9X175_PHACE|nr:unnamed protein product [Phaedon cochleariae]
MMEAHFKNVDYLRSHRKIRIFSLVSSWIAILQNSITFVIDVLSFFPTTVTLGDTNGVLTYTIPLFTSSFVILQFCGCMLVMKEKFRWVNQELKALVRTWKKYFKTKKAKLVMENHSEYLRYDEGLFADILENLRMRYYHIHSLTEELNDIFAISSLFTVLQCFLSLLMYVMYLVRGLERATWYKTIMFRCLCGAVFLVDVMKLSTLTYTSSFLTTEADIRAPIERTDTDNGDNIECNGRDGGDVC